MNRFRTRRRAKEEAAAAAKLSAEPKHSGEAEPSNPFRLFNKPKKSHDEPVEKPIDLSTVLPSTDDFRTSLLMTGLSARFSMLREQDDPNTKIGKASDDSVLFPKRGSRMPDLAFRGLGDIAEVDSIRAPPSLTRMDSYNSSSDADSTNVMNRPRPTEGNVLFGGRQKIYKISPGTSSGSGGGMGKAIYGDDVALSSFQRWKQAERDKQASEEDDAANTVSSPLSRNFELEALRPESPPSYNRNRETGSTTSSAPSASRNSTAATSVTSQKDWHYLGSSASPTPIQEKTVARTRRLYEQGLTQDLQNQQSHALSRMDTLSRRTPDISQKSSPTGQHFGERPMERRLLSKGSAPNMHTSSNPASARSVTSPTDLGLRTHGASETKTSGASPPLSPPVSENDEHSVLQIQSSDKGKATAMGVFQKPAQPYDESRFAQRQIQMQQGRDTPTQGFRTESDTSRLAQRSPSPVAPSSSTASKPDVSPVKNHPPVESHKQSLTFFDDDDDAPADTSQDRQILSGQPLQVRPADKDHPAFRSSALPTPLSLNFKDSDDGQTSLTTPNTSAPSTGKDPRDSPTLGPPAGLSGMVRQHLRSDSGASSVYGAEPQLRAPSSKPAAQEFSSKALDDLVSDLNPWATQDQGWTASFYGGSIKQDGHGSPAAKVQDHTPFSQSASARQSVASSDVGTTKDAFHSQLADGARRIRERLTSYVETDGGNGRDFASTPEPTLRPGPLGGLLRKQSSRGSLEKHLDVSKPVKAIKLLGIGNATMSTSPSPNKQSFEESEHVLPPTQQSPERGSPGKSSGEEEKGDTAHAGLRQFRQARRELQRLKEAETMQRHQNSTAQGPEPGNGGSPINRGPPLQSRPGQGRSPSRERRPPPISYSRAPSTEPRAGPGSNPSSRAASRTGSRPHSRTDRDRSGSEASSGGMPHSRPPPRPRAGPRDEYQHGPQHGPKPAPMQSPSYGPPGIPRQGPMMRSNGPPGSDMRRSPMAPAQPYSPQGQSEWPGPHNPMQYQQQQRGMTPGQPSPISPMGDLPSPFMTSGRSTPNGTTPSSRRPSAPPMPSPDSSGSMARLEENMKRVVRKKDISEPTFVSSTSRVPTVNLPEEMGTRSQSGSRSRSGSLLQSGLATASTPNLHSLQQSHANAPPLPPINPRRRNVIGSLMGRKGEEDMNLDSPQLPFGADSGDENQSTFSVSDEEDGRDRRRLRKATSEANVGSRSRSGTLRNSPPHLAGLSSASPSVRRNGMPGGLI